MRCCRWHQVISHRIFGERRNEIYHMSYGYDLVLGKRQVCFILPSATSCDDPKKPESLWISGSGLSSVDRTCKRSGQDAGEGAVVDDLPLVSKRRAIASTGICLTSVVATRSVRRMSASRFPAGMVNCTMKPPI